MNGKYELSETAHKHDKFVVKIFARKNMEYTCKPERHDPHLLVQTLMQIFKKPNLTACKVLFGIYFYHVYQTHLLPKIGRLENQSNFIKSQLHVLVWTK